MNFPATWEKISQGCVVKTWHVTFQNRSRGDEVMEDFPPSSELLFPSPPSSHCKASFFHRNDLKFKQALLSLPFPPNFRLILPGLKWRGHVNKSWGNLVHHPLPRSLKTVLEGGGGGWRANPFTFCWLISLKRASRDASADVEDFSFELSGHQASLGVCVMSEPYPSTLVQGSAGCFPSKPSSDRSEHIQKPYVLLPEIYSMCKCKNIHCRFFSHNLAGFYCLSRSVRQPQSDTLTHSDFVVSW